jgi:membrane protein implicated in regulation of membrane protease activity
MTALIVFFVVALLATFAVALGAGGFLLVLVFVVLAAALIWVAATFVSGRRPSQAVRRTKRPRLLGPGGPDDPERTSV